MLGGTYNQMKGAISHGNLSPGLLCNCYDIQQFPTSSRNYLTETLQNIVSQTNIDMFKKYNDCILFSCLLLNSKLVAMGKRGKQLTPMDTQVLISFVRSISSKDSLSFMPLCLNDFNESAHVHLFVKYITSNVIVVFGVSQFLRVPSWRR